MQLLSFSKKNDINKSVSPVHARLFLYRNQSGESIAVAITLSLAITALLFAVHPLIYGDAIYYALDISQGKSIWTDPGHLLWRPLVFFLHRIISCFAPIDPLTSFQLLSALSVFLLFVSGHLLFLRFYPHSKLGIVFILFIGGNYFFLAHSASGSSYVPSLAASTLCFYFITRGRMTAASLLYLLSFEFWSLAALSFFPLVLASFFLSPESIPQRIQKGLYFLIATSVLCTITHYFIFYLTKQHGSASTIDFIAWLRASDHAIPAGFGMINSARALLGLCYATVTMGDFGYNIKELLLNAKGLTISSSIIIYSTGFTVYFSFFISSLVLHGLLWKMYSHRIRAFVFICFIAMAFNFVFAAWWQGSDIERFSPSLIFIGFFLMTPFVTLIMAGNKYQKYCFGYVLSIIFFLWIYNLCLTVIPTSLRYDYQLRAFLAQSGNTYQKGDLLITDGQNLGDRISGPIHYFTGAQVENIYSDVRRNGVTGWNIRMQDVIRDCLKSGGNVYVLSDLPGNNAASPGIERNSLKQPTAMDIQHFFRRWTFQKGFTVAQYRFLRIDGDGS